MPDKYDTLLQDKPVTIKVTCGDCIYFKHAAYYTDGHKPQPCSVLGRSAKQTPCPAYQMNPYEIDFNNSAVMTLSKLSMLTPPDKLSILAALIMQESLTRSKGYYFGQNVYVRIYPEDFISNWAVAKVLFANNKDVYVQGKRGFRALFKHESILSETRWVQHEKHLRSIGRLIDPQLQHYCYNGNGNGHHHSRINLTDKTSVPTIDQFDSSNNTMVAATNINTSEEVYPRKRGRPRKNRIQ